MKKLYEMLLKRSLLFIILIFTVSILGVYTFLTIDQREIPETEVNLINVTTAWPGADKSDIESNISDIIESEIFGVENTENISSVSQDGVSVITMEISDGGNPKDVLNEVNNVVGGLISELPENAAEPEVQSMSNTFPLLSYQIYSDDAKNLENIQSDLDALEQEVSQMDGIDSVTVKGYSDYKYEIQLDWDALSENQLNPNEIMSEIETSLNPVILGQETDEDEIIRLSFQDATPIEVLEQVRVGQDNIPLTDVADLEQVQETPEDIVEYEGNPAVSFTVFLANSEDVPSVSKNVETVIDDRFSELPEDITVENISSERENVEDIFVGLYTSLAIALIAVIIATSLGLSWFGSITVTVTVLLSVLIGLLPVPWFGVDLNQISVIGLIIALGILVDDSIVINDNIERRLTLGDNRLDGVYNGVKEVAPSVIASTLAIVFTFSPLLLLSGANGDFIKALPSILISTMIISTVLSLTFVPAVRYLIVRKKAPKHPGIIGKAFSWGSNVYADKFLPKIVRRPLVSFFTVLIVAVLSLGLIKFTPFEFFPEADRSEVTLDLIFEEGQTIEKTHEDAKDVLSYLLEEIDHVESASIFTGDGLPNLFGASLDQSGPNTAQIALQIDKEEMSASETINNYEESVQEAFPEATIFMETIIQGPPASAPITVEFFENDLEKLNNAVTSLTESLENEGAIVTSSIGSPVSTLNYSIDYDALEENDISVSQVKNELNMLSEGIPIQEIIVDGESRETSLKYSDAFTIDNVDIVKVGEGEPETYPLSDFVTIEETEDTTSIQHSNGERTAELQVYSEDEEAVNQTIDDFGNSLDGSTELIVGGESSDQTDFFIEIGILFSVILVLVYLVIAWEFNSIVMPLIIVFSIFLAFSGGIIGLFVTQTPISFLGIMGMVSLSGIVVRNAVVLIDFIEARRKAEEFNIHEAIFESGRARFKPVALTTLTSILALVPVALSGDVLFEPLAVTVIAGLAFSTILSLIATPALYYLYYRIRYRK
ncbi:efflux RND transporter permease subunit [Salinicoccus sp. HZC-1]|uniref:efflux RND transporter permease subunit n=1 Tax=Salinicoccus sp. HZC-1 TaxID=3385497 RepID=UPI00398AA55E